MSTLVAIYFCLILQLKIEWNKIVSDDYSPNGTYMVLEPPSNLITYIGSLFYFDPIGSCYIVSDGVEYYFDKSTGYLEKKIHKGIRGKYIKTNYFIPLKSKYNLITNNCKHLIT